MPTNLTITACNGFDQVNLLTVGFTENAGEGMVLGKLNGFKAGEDLSQLIFTPVTGSGSPADDSGRFSIVQAQSDGNGYSAGDWVVVVQDITKMDYETADLFFGAIKFVSSAKSGYSPVDTYNASFGLNMQDVNESPKNVALSNDTVTEEQLGIPIGSLSSFDEDDDYWANFPGPITYAVGSGLDSDLFTLSADGQTLMLKAGVKLDYETAHFEDVTGKHYYDVVITATDAGAYDIDGNQTTGVGNASADRVVRVYVEDSTVDDLPVTPVVEFDGASLTVSQGEGDAGMTAYTFTITRSGSDLSGPSMVDWAVTGTGTNPADGADFSGVLPAGSVTFEAGETSKTFTVNVAGDTAFEADEQFQVALSAGANAALGTNTTATGTITNDDAEPVPPVLTIDDVAVPEGNGETTLVTFTVTRTGDTSGASSVDWALAHGTTAAGDFLVDAAHPLSGTVSFEAGETSKTIVLQVDGDAAFEPDETFAINLSNASNATISDASGTGTITNDDAAPVPVVQFSSPAPSVSQGEGDSGTVTYTYFVIRDTTVGSSTVNWAVTGSGSDPADGTDFGGTLPSGQVTFADGENVKSFTVSVSGDAAFEADEQFTVTLSAGTNASVNANNVATGTITNDDAEPLPPVLTIDDVAVPEGNGETTLVTFTVTRTGDTSGASSVDWALAHGTTAAGDFLVDAAHPLSGTVSFEAGETSKTIVLQVDGDAAFEPDETFAINLSNASNATIGDASGAGAITNDDVAPTPVVEFDGASLTVSQGEGDAGMTAYTFTITRSGSDLSGPSMVDWAVTGTGTNPADGADFSGVLPAGSVTFEAGETSKTFTVNVAGDTAFEADEQFQVALWAGANAALGTNTTATGTITNDDAEPVPPVLTIDDVAVPEGNGETTLVTFTVTRTGDTSGASSVDWALAHGTTAAGDFLVDAAHPLSGTVSFEAGETSKTIVLQVDGDAAFEPDETFTVNLSNASNATVGDASGTGTITNDDAAPVAPEFSIAATDAVKAEGDSGFTELTFTITRSGDTSVAGSVKWAVEGIGDHPAANGDFIAGFLSNVETFDAGQETKQITIQVAGDLAWEADETFHVVLSEPTNGTISVTQGAADGTIVDDDRPILSIASQTGPQVDEGDTGMVDYVFRVFRDDTGAPSSATWTVSGEGIDADDFDALTGTVAFAADEQFKDIVLKVKSDKIEELNETFTITLSDAVDARLGSQSAATGTIVNDDHEPTFQVMTGQDYFTGTQGVAIDGVLAGIDLDDADGDALTLRVSFKDLNGTLNGMATGGGVTVTDLGTDPNGFHSYKLDGSAADIETLLGGVSFTPAHGNETTSFSFTLTDGSNLVRAYGDKITVLGEFPGNHAPVPPSASVVVHEGKDAGSVVATFAEMDAEGTTIDYQFFGAQADSDGKISGDGRFQIVGNTIVALDLSVTDDAQATYVVKASDGTYTVDGNLTIVIKNNLAPAIDSIAASGSGQAGDAGTILVSETAGAVEIATVTAADPDAAQDGRALTYTLADTYDGLFAIDADGKIRIADATKLPVDAGTPYELTVKVSDGSDTTTQDVTVKVAKVPDQNHGPTAPALTLTHAPNEYEASGTLVGTLAAADQDGDALSYALLDSAGGRFKLVNGNQLVVDNGFLFDFEQAAAHKIAVLVSDGHGGTATQVFDIGVGNIDPERTSGTAGNDVFYGGARSDKLYGGAGADRLFGGAGKDTVKGLSGNDILGGGSGKDKLYGGKGKFSRDMFVFDTKLKSAKAAKSHTDKIYDFGPKYDSLGFDDAVFKNKTIAKYVKKKHGATLDHKLKIDKHWFRVGDKALDKNDFFIYNDRTHKLYFDADGSGHKAMVEVASFTSHFEKHAGTHLTHKDFFLI